MNSELKSVLNLIDKTHGKGSAFVLGERKILPIDVIPTGSLCIDQALGVGGIPRGRVTEIYGPPSGGKTTLTLHVIANAQKMGLQAAFIDAENALDPIYARSLGVDIDKLIVSQPDCGEQALEIADALLKSGQVGIVVIDSVAALVPRAEIEGEMGTPQMGLQARLMSQALRKLNSATSKSNAALIFINQIRMKIGVMFGSPETTSGGEALKFFSSVRMDVRRIKTNSEGDDKVSNTVKVKVVKNKCATPFKEAEVEIVFGEGICRESDLITLGVAHNLIEKSGAWFTYEGRRFQGEANLKDALKEEPAVATQLEAKLRSLLFEAK